MDLGTCLRAARDNADLKQKEVADRAGINYKTLSNWEHNVSKPNPDDLKTLANIYGTSIDELIGYISSHTPGPQKALNKKEMLWQCAKYNFLYCALRECSINNKSDLNLDGYSYHMQTYFEEAIQARTKYECTSSLIKLKSFVLFLHHEQLLDQ